MSEGSLDLRTFGHPARFGRLGDEPRSYELRTSRHRATPGGAKLHDLAPEPARTLFPPQTATIPTLMTTFTTSTDLAIPNSPALPAPDCGAAAALLVLAARGYVTPVDLGLGERLPLFLRLLADLGGHGWPLAYRPARWWRGERWMLGRDRAGQHLLTSDDGLAWRDAVLRAVGDPRSQLNARGNLP